MTEYKKAERCCQAETLLRWGIGAAAVAAAGIAVGSLAFAYGSTHPRRRRVSLPDGESLSVEEVRFPSRDGLTLSGWFVPRDGAKAAVILCHGFPANRVEMLPWARMLHDAGFHVLLFDFRALGESEGELCGIGGHETADLLGAADYLESRPEMAGRSFGVFGLSMGGAVSIMTAAEDLRFAAVATHGAYATLERAIAQRCRLLLGPLGPALHHPAVWWGRRWFPTHPRQVSPEALVGRIAPRPLLLLHGERDLTVCTRDATSLYAAAREPKRLLTLRRSWHVRIDAQELPAYERVVTEFFRKSLLT